MTLILNARKVVDSLRGVRFIQLYHRDWDHHNNLKSGVAYKAEEVDRPVAALIKIFRPIPDCYIELCGASNSACSRLSGGAFLPACSTLRTGLSSTARIRAALL